VKRLMPEGREAEVALAEAQLAELIYHARTHTESVAKLAGRIVNDVLLCELLTLDANGQATREFGVAYGSVAVANFGDTDLTVAQSGLQGSAPGGGAGLALVGSLMGQVINLSGRALSLYGTAGARVMLQVFTKPQPPSYGPVVDGEGYVLPALGIPSSDMTAAVQASLAAADDAYALPALGIPATDLTAAVQASLGRADTALQVARGNRVVYLGDSCTIAQGNDQVSTFWGLSFPSYATYLSKGRLLRVANAGVAGNTAADMLARFSADVAAYSPSLVVIMAGTNDWNDFAPTPLGTYQANIRDLVAACRTIRAAPVLCTVPPNIISSARRGRTIIGNTWLRTYCQDEGIPLIDFYTLLVDPATGGYLAAYALDGTHPNNPGYVAMGSFLNAALLSWLPPVDPLLPMENADPNNLLTNGLNLTTTGAGTTLMPTGWSVQTSVHPAGVTGSLVTGDATIKGNWWRVVADGSAAATNNEYQVVAGIVPGHTYAHVGRFKATGLSNVDSTAAGSRFLLGHAYNSSLLVAGYDFRVASTHSYDVTEGTFYQESLAPFDAATCLVRRQLLQTTVGAGTLQVAQTGFYDLTAMGLA